MKIVIDLQCCQTGAQNRGMGRYTSALTREIVRLGHRHDFMFLLNYKYLAQSQGIVAQLREIGAMGEVVYYDHPDVQRGWNEREVREDIGSLLRNNRIETLSPDLYHISSLFEGESVFGAAASFTTLPKGPILRSATLYDFVPYLYASQYLTHWQYATWYKRTLGVARGLDIGLAISETTKTAAETLLQGSDLNVVNILGSVDDRFRVLPESERHRGPIWSRLKPGERYVLYVGGPDPRKNVDATLRAFALMCKELREPCKLVLVYDVSDSEVHALHVKAQALGIRQHIVVAGFVSDDELVELYNCCTLFIFPSLYEGLGLPVIEAMRCGAPVLVGDNSSQREIVDRAAYRFDAGSDVDIARTMTAVLDSADRQGELRSYGLERAQAFSWERSARAALDAWEEAHARRVSTRASRPPVTARERPRIAMFTPLPDAATGIADYAADFVPQLCRFAELDLFVDDVAAVKYHQDGVGIRHHHEITGLAGTYDAIVYQLGNSPFHHYMLPYIPRYPGIVVIHDAYLGHLSHDPGAPAAFVRQVIGDHGGAARAIMLDSANVPEGVRQLIADLTCSPTHVHRSLGVMVHSHFAKGLLKADMRAAIGPEIAVVPQYVAPIPKERRNRAAARRRLGLSPDGIVLASFGHVAPTKGILELIASFRASTIGRSGKATLVLVGEVEGGRSHPTEFGRKVLAEVERGSDVIVTDYVDQETFELYMDAIDFGVQLRTITRGETSRAMLTLLVNEIPFIHNRFGSSVEMPETVALGIDSIEPQVLADALDRLASDSALRAELARAQAVYAREELAGPVAAERFVGHVTRMAARARACHPAALAADIARVMRGSEPDPEITRATATAFVNQELSEVPPRLLIDVSHIREHDLQTGVQRVVRQITRNAYVSRDHTTVPQTFAFTERGVVFADDYAQASGARHEVEEALVRTGPLTLRPFDRMLLADGSWHLSDWMRSPLEQLNAVGGSAYALIHDILPLQRPDLFHEHVVVSIRKWLSLMVEQCAGLICTSRTAADGLIAYFAAQEQIAVRPGLRLGWSHLGSDPLDETSEAGGSRLTQPALRGCRNLYLVVGTIEPRKGHGDVLDAFEQIWAADHDATLVFVGKRGWNIDALAERMEAHPEAGRRFIELGFVDDDTLFQLYRQARAAIVASIAEGFGLPIFEAAHLGTPLILSDLPVFRELGGAHARYFRAGSADDLAGLLSSSLTNEHELPPSNRIAPPSWKQCYVGIECFMNDLDTYHRF